jgi:glutathione peroxidase
MGNVYDFTVDDIRGEPVALDRYKGRTLLIVNVASRCGFTPQYAGLQALQERFSARGFDVLGFPCNQFGAQEPKGEVEIARFCKDTFHVTFPMFAKIMVNGADAAPLYRFLKAEKPGLLGTEAIKWNFTKFLVDKNGDVVKRYAPSDAPESIAPDIERALSSGAPIED